MAANAAAKQRPRGPGRPFQAGRSGNPAGKRKGTRHQVTLLAERLMADDAEAVVRRVVEAAKAGDMTAARLILDRVVPARRGRPVAFALPEVNTPHGITAALAAVVKAMSNGTISPDEAAAVAAVIESQRRAIETERLETRMLAIEESLKSNEQKQH
jgi:Family of unknown function (DUF5681)